jgi:hypothetical protein
MAKRLRYTKEEGERDKMRQWDNKRERETETRGEGPILGWA